MRRVAQLSVVVLSALGVRRALARRAALDRVADDLRSPVLYVIPSLRSDRALRFVRRLAAKATPPAVESRTTAEGVRVLVYDAPGRDRPSGALLWIHGGGLVLGVPEQGHDVCTRFAEEAGVFVASVEYRLAPDHPFPAGLDDCLAALRWLHEQADALGIDPSRIAVGGDSAGGGLSAAACQRAVDDGGPPIAFQLLAYPMLDDRTVLRTDLDAKGVYLWTPASNAYAWSAYLGREPTLDLEPPVHAVPARREDLAGLPPAWIGVGDLDLFLDEDVAYARRLEAAGVPCDLMVVPGMWHGADSILPSAGTSKRFRDAMVDALARAVGNRASSEPPRRASRGEEVTP